MKKVLLTGAAGYVGSHAWVALLAAGYEVVGLDNFSNSSPEVLNRLARISGATPVFVQADVRDHAALATVMERHRFDAVVHFAALKSVGESVTHPLDYYLNNIGGLLSLCRAMQAAGCMRIVFSSSATVYGNPDHLPVNEAAKLSATNPYGHTKVMSEQILSDLISADPSWQTACLRYFNPVGAHPSGLIGEHPRGVPNNLMPYVAQVAVGARDQLNVYGQDYDTPDGTGVRDYIHVMDLARGHVAALDRLMASRGSFTVNLGTGRGYSVLEIIRAFEHASGRRIPFTVMSRRPGDIASCYADTSLSTKLLGWHAEHGLDDMCSDVWRWQSNNPKGYDG